MTLKHNLKTALEQETYTGMKGELVLFKEDLQQLSDEQLYSLSAKWLRDEILGASEK